MHHLPTPLNIFIWLLEIQEIENYLDDNDFVDAIKEDLPIIIKYLKTQVRMLEKLESIDPNNKFLKDYSPKAIEEKAEKYAKENEEFIRAAKENFENRLKKAYRDDEDEVPESTATTEQKQEGGIKEEKAE